ncbi:hypothetical protein CEXT_770191 [Caerostris extrusa]|uniref:Ycf15 n=1 Tax=Caerostris extrusa TaxID=172846 RepID=A0AAV4REY7_CAEEX|nr:hypothetical protein CEXT_770191 [Caerostris extrusa]
MILKKISLGVHLPIGYKDTFPLLSVKPDPLCLLFQKQKLRCFPTRRDSSMFRVHLLWIRTPLLLRYKRKWRSGP